MLIAGGLISFVRQLWFGAFVARRVRLIAPSDDCAGDFRLRLSMAHSVGHQIADQLTFSRQQQLTFVFVTVVGKRSQQSGRLFERNAAGRVRPRASYTVAP